MEACADLDQRRQPPVDLDPSFGRPHDAREVLQHRALAGAVVTDHADRFALPDLQADVAQRPELARQRVASAAFRAP